MDDIMATVTSPHIAPSTTSAVKAGNTSSGNIWGDIIQVAVPAIASLAGGYLSGQGGRAAADAEADAARDVVNLQRDIYTDQRGLARPGYMTGGAATNLLGAQFGIAPQDYTVAYNGLNAGPIGSGGGGGTTLPNLGAGQPVAGHSGGGTNGLVSGLGSAAGAVAGNMILPGIGGAIGSTLGGAVGGMFRQSGPEGDNWTTLQTQAPGGYDYDAYFASDPGLAKEWAKKDVRSLFNGNRDAYLHWHYTNMGQGEGRTLAPLGGGQQTPQPVGGPQLEGQSGGTGTGTATGAPTNGLVNPMAGFMSSPYGQIATSGFRGVDVPEVNSAFARGGKVLSGAQSIALDDRGKARLGGAYTDYTNGLRSLAGLNQTASSQIGGAAQNFGVNAGNAMIRGGEASGRSLESGYNGLTQGVSGAVDSVMNFGKKRWGWT